MDFYPVVWSIWPLLGATAIGRSVRNWAFCIMVVFGLGTIPLNDLSLYFLAVQLNLL